MYSPLMLELLCAQRQADAKRNLGRHSRKPSPPQHIDGWRRRFARRLIALSLCLDPAAADVAPSRETAAH
jgi:hypothetical protein